MWPNSQENADLVTSFGQILNGKLLFFFEVYILGPFILPKLKENLLNHNQSFLFMIFKWRTYFPKKGILTDKVLMLKQTLTDLTSVSMYWKLDLFTAQKIKISIKDFFCKYDQMCIFPNTENNYISERSYLGEYLEYPFPNLQDEKPTKHRVKRLPRFSKKFRKMFCKNLKWNLQ